MTKHMIQQKTSAKCQKPPPEKGKMDNEGIELVKHMSNLPKYLQQAEHGKSIQEKALQFGVIDWKRLEKWKPNECAPARGRHESLSSHVCDVPSSHHQEEKLLVSSMKNSRAKGMVSSQRSYANTSIGQKDKRKDSYPKYVSFKEDYLFLDQVKNAMTSAQDGNSSSSSKMKTDNKSNLSPHFCAPELSSKESGGKQQNLRKKPKSTSFNSFEISQKRDHGIFKQPALSNDHPSPSRRLSSSHNRLNRSFSFNDTSVNPLSDKESSSWRGTSSAFMRLLLHPLQRSKGVHSAKTDKRLNGILSSLALKPKEKHLPSTTEALLHFTFKNGLPIFKFAADNGSDIMVAAVNKLPTSVKEEWDGCLMYSFRKVPETKKKRSKGCGHSYNDAIAMMKVSEDCLDESVLRQSILYSVGFRQENKQAPEFLANKEMAAIMVMNQITKFNTSRQRLAEERYLMNDRKKSSDIVVILPSGIHGLPQNGAPSSLIERWRSGGLCDCGGWDLGCKLRVFTGEEKNGDNLDSISLLHERGECEKKAVFVLSPLKNGLYSVRYDASFALLEAFSTCVAIITSQKLSYMLERPMEEKVNSGVSAQRRGPARYVSSPRSPVARI